MRLRFVPALALLLATATLHAGDTPSKKEQAVLDKAEPGVPVTLPGKGIEPVMPSPFATSSPSSRESRIHIRNKKEKTRKAAAPQLNVQAFWFEGGEGKRRVVIDLSHQVAQVWTGDQLTGQSPVSTGRGSFATPAGSYRIQQKSKDHKSNLYGSWVDASGKYAGDANAGSKRPRPGLTYAPAPMPFFLRLTGCGIGMHAGYVPGFPASHGCIRLPLNMAERFFHSLELGTPVEIRP